MRMVKIWFWIPALTLSGYVILTSQSFGILLYKMGHMLVVGFKWGNEGKNIVQDM